MCVCNLQHCNNVSCKQMNYVVVTSHVYIIVLDLCINLCGCSVYKRIVRHHLITIITMPYVYYFCVKHFCFVCLRFASFATKVNPYKTETQNKD